jgi:hypothetical protein
VATFTQLASGNWRVQVRRKTRYVAETFRRRKDGEEWALEMERNIDRKESFQKVPLVNLRDMMHERFCCNSGSSPEDEAASSHTITNQSARHLRAHVMN